jgi:hypothetical protein
MITIEVRPKLREQGTGSLYERGKSPMWYCKMYQHGEPVRMSTGTDDRVKAEQERGCPHGIP